MVTGFNDLSPANGSWTVFLKFQGKCGVFIKMALKLAISCFSLYASLSMIFFLAFTQYFRRQVNFFREFVLKMKGLPKVFENYYVENHFLLQLYKHLQVLSEFKKQLCFVQ